MSLDADHIVDRRRMRRKLTFWRVLAVLVAIVAIVVAAVAYGARGFSQASRQQIARVTIRGLILGDQDRVEALAALAKQRNARAVIVHVDSPGGTVVGSEQLYDALRRISESKPTVVVVDGMAASGGYIAAMASDHIIAQSMSLVGSVGVLFQYPNFTDLLKTIGVQVETIRSTPLKATPDGFGPTSPESRAAVESIVMDSYAWFRGTVQDRRKLTGEALGRVVDGRVFTGRQAMDLKLIDEIGNEQTALDWLAKQKGVDPKLPVRDWRLAPRLSQLSFLHLGAAAAFDALGLSSLAARFADTGAVQALDRLNLDGLLALWHPPVAN
ncbi:MAG TPA: signal peptide peptidase SppA [Xanthobacteraceae bacterium]|jgi:protease-4|nr:signal peptide peptidase SppA [Xanthobacteraceae bacterium]